MKASISSLYFSDLNPAEMVQRFAVHGWRHLELSKGHAHDLVAQGAPEVSGKALRQSAADLGITFLQGHLPVLEYESDDRSQGTKGWFDNAPASDRALARAMEVTGEWLDLFAALGIQVAVVHMGGSTLKKAGWSDEAVFERRLEALARITTRASELGVVVCLENMSFPNSGVRTLEQIQALISGLGAQNIAVCLDTGHAHLADLDCAEFVRNAGSTLAALHLHENSGAEDHHALPYEYGVIPWDDVLTALGEVGYEGALNLEIPGRPRSPMVIREARLGYARAIAMHMLDVAST